MESSLKKFCIFCNFFTFLKSFFYLFEIYVGQALARALTN